MHWAWLWAVGVLAAAASEPDSGVNGTPATRHQFAQVEMGVQFTITLYASDEIVANRAAEAAFRRVAELNAIMSDYDAESELMRLSRTAGQGKPVTVSPELWFVLSRSVQLSKQSGGAFDVTVGSVVRLWRRARRQHDLPSRDRLSDALAAVGYKYLRFDDSKRTVELTRSGTRLDLGGIAKGYAGDEVLAVLARHGITRALVDAGGDVVIGDPPPNTPGWRIGVAPLEKPDGPPSRFLLLANVAVATSGDAFQYVEIDGRRYSHIVDPKTGLGLTDHSSVTVVAADGTTADGLASAVSVLGPEAGLRLVGRFPGAAALVVRREGRNVELYESCGWHRLAAGKGRP